MKMGLGRGAWGSGKSCPAVKPLGLNRTQLIFLFMPLMPSRPHALTSF